MPNNSSSVFYKENGYAIHNQPIIPEKLINRALSRIPNIIDKDYDMGIPPSRIWNLGDEKKIQKVDQIHRCDSAFFDLVTYPKLGEAVAKICGVDAVQIWDTQLFIKPAGGGNLGNIGWHTDEVNWYWWAGDVFTIWLPLVDVNKDIGTISYLPGSHNWDVDMEIKDAYTQKLQETELKIKDQIGNNPFNPEYVEIPRGAFSLHHKKILHGSAENKSNCTRVCIAINARTEHSTPLHERDNMGFLKHINNPVFSPIIYKK